VHVEDVQHSLPVKLDVTAQAAALFPAAHAYVVVLRSAQRETAEQHVAVGPAFEHSRAADIVIKLQTFGDISRLVMLGRVVWNAQDFLQGYYIGVYLAQDLYYSFRSHATIKPSTFMNIVCRYPYSHTEYDER
jgi:hypothetical protein